MTKAVPIQWSIEGRDTEFCLRINFDDDSVEFCEVDGSPYYPAGFYSGTLEGLIDALEQARNALGV